MSSNNIVDLDNVYTNKRRLYAYEFIGPDPVSEHGTLTGHAPCMVYTAYIQTGWRHRSTLYMIQFIYTYSSTVWSCNECVCYILTQARCGRVMLCCYIYIYSSQVWSCNAVLLYTQKISVVMLYCYIYILKRCA